MKDKKEKDGRIKKITSIKLRVPNSWINELPKTVNEEIPMIFIFLGFRDLEKQ